VASVCACGEYFNVDPETGELCLNPGMMGLRQILYFEVGTHQFRKDEYPWLSRVRARVQAGGGGSAGANAADGECIVRPGAAGGGYSESLLEASALGDVESVVVGEGGTPGSGNADGGPGGSSSFGGLVTATGGAGGASSQTSGTNPTCTSGTVGPLAGTGDFRIGGGAGGSAIRLTGAQGVAGQGGESHLGHGGWARSSEGQGGATRGFGAGAGGALSHGESVSGGSGGNGRVIVELYG